MGKRNQAPVPLLPIGSQELLGAIQPSITDLVEFLWSEYESDFFPNEIHPLDGDTIKQKWDREEAFKAGVRSLYSCLQAAQWEVA